MTFMVEGGKRIWEMHYRVSEKRYERRPKRQYYFEEMMAKPDHNRLALH